MTTPEPTTRASWPRRALLLVGAVAVAVLGLLGMGRLAGSDGGRWSVVVPPPVPSAAVVGAPDAPAPTPTPGAPAPSLDLADAAPTSHSVHPVPDPDWVARTAELVGIPPRAMQAYAAATLALGRDEPGCALGWTTLAAIGAVESGHGSHGGATLLADGRTSVPILGPALDGAGGFAAIPASPTSTAWHGDPRWDHALGPMQFIPSTWARWGTDGDGDGVADPFDIDDAAVAAGRYLCASGRAMTGDGWRAAVLSYNHSEEYVAAVLDRANRYARAAQP